MAALHERRAPLILLAMTLVAALLMCFRLDAQSLWLDEGNSWALVTRSGWLLLLADLFSPHAGYPLYHLLLKGWVVLAGDAEWVLRLPSALAGATTVALLIAAAAELQGRDLRTAQPGALIAAGLIGATAPFLLWHAQDAKAYSLLACCIAAALWLLLRALRTSQRRIWIALAVVVLISLFVHRLALFGIAGIALGAALTYPAGAPRMRSGLLLLAAGCALAGIGGASLALWDEAGEGRRATGILNSIQQTFTQFSLRRWPGEAPTVAFLPALLLSILGIGFALYDAVRRYAPAMVLLCACILPLALFLASSMLLPAFEVRYAMSAFPAWLLLLIYPLVRARTTQVLPPPTVPAIWLLVLLVLAANLFSLLQPAKGQFSGAPIKEQWREAVHNLALRVHPDDLVVVHPYYVLPLYTYYQRVTPDPLPPPTTFPVFAQGYFEQTSPDVAQEAVRRVYEPLFREAAHGKKRSLLLIAPDHAATVDPPVAASDRFGWVGLRYAFEQRTWPCGGAEFVGVLVMCQSYPELFGIKRAIPEPQTPLEASFGGQLRLRGYTILPAGGQLRPGGTLPITLYWAAERTPTQDYRMFLHLCRDCESPPDADQDGPPLGGYGEAGRTTTWRIGDPVHDERSIALPPDLPPGRYTLLLGVSPPDDPAAEARLPISSRAPTLAHNRLVLAEVEIQP